MENAGYVWLGRTFTAVVICFGNFIATNVIVSIILINIDRATKKFRVRLVANLR